jgi:beta-lactamase regulating signal transducer with metallopeptidase domain
MTPFLHAAFQALGFTLLHFCWQGAAIAALYAVILRLLPILRSDTRYVLGLSALLAMAGAAAVTFGYELTRHASGEMAAGGFDTLAGGEAGAPPLGEILSRWLPLLDALWLTGVALLSLRMAGGLWAIRRLSAEARDVPEAVRRRFDAALDRAGLAGRALVRLNPHIDGPFVVGIVRAVVYLPLSAVTVLAPDQLDAVFAHELAHVRRADYAWNLLQTVIETLFFFHPAVWWIGAALREQRELCCDDVALAACHDPVTYATALLSLEEQRRAPRSGNTLAMALNGQGSRRSLLSRITRILGDQPGRKASRSTPLMPLALPVVLLTLAAVLLPMSHVAARPQADTGSAPRPIPARTLAAVDTDAPEAADDSPAPEATQADVAPDESAWNFVRDANAARTDQARKAADQQAADAQAIDTRDLEAMAVEAQRTALAELREHKADIQRAIADARRAGNDAQALNQIDLARIQATIQATVQAETRTADQARARASLSEAEIREIKAHAEQIAAEARSTFKADTFRTDWAKSWTPEIPPAPAAPPAPPAAPALPAPAPDPAPHPVALAVPVSDPVVIRTQVKTVKAPVTRLDKPCREDVKVSMTGKGDHIRVVSDGGKLVTVDLKGPEIGVDSHVDNRVEVHTETE